MAVWETGEKRHGRLETRHHYQSAALDWFADRAAWEGLRTVGMVEATWKTGGKQTVERRYYPSSLPLDVEQFARAVREHWGVETKCLGCWTCNSTRIKAGRAPDMQRRTAAPCAAGC